MEDPLSQVKAESERFLREEIGAEGFRFVNCLEFMEIVSNNGLEAEVGVRNFRMAQVPHTQAYVELNGVYVYSTTLN